MKRVGFRSTWCVPVLTPTPSLPPLSGECTTDGMPIRSTLVNPGAAYTTEKRPSDYHCGMLSFELCLPPESSGATGLISPFFKRVISIAPRLVSKRLWCMRPMLRADEVEEATRAELLLQDHGSDGRNQRAKEQAARRGCV